MPIRRVKGGFILVAAMLAAVGASAGEPFSPNALGLIPPILDVRYANSFAPELFADLMLTSVTVQRTFAHTIPSIVDYSQTAHATAAGPVDSTNALASLYPSYCTPGKNWVMWDTPFLVRETRKRGGDGYLGYEQNASGFATGITRMLGETSAVGLALGYDYRKLNGRDGYHWRERADVFHSALYGGTALGCLFLDAYAGFSHERQRTERNVEEIPIITPQAKYSQDVLSAGLKASYVWILPSEFRIIPAIGLDYSHVRMGSFNERRDDGSLFSSVGKSNFNNLTMPIIVSANHTFATDFLAFGGRQARWTPEVRGGWTPQFGAKQASVNAIGSTPVASRSAPLADSYGTVGAGLKIQLRDRFIFAVDYDYKWAANYSNHTLTGAYGVSF